jgi:hypothetical protein
MDSPIPWGITGWPAAQRAKEGEPLLVVDVARRLAGSKIGPEQVGDGFDVIESVPLLLDVGAQRGLVGEADAERWDAG